MRLSLQLPLFPPVYIDLIRKTALRCFGGLGSFMSGRRPDTTRVFEFLDHFREVGVGHDWLSLPGYFKLHGYLTLGGGKL